MFRRIRIKNFKSIRDLELELTPVTVLTGESMTGKSTVLEAMDFFCSGVRLSYVDWVHEQGLTVGDLRSTLPSTGFMSFSCEVELPVIEETNQYNFSRELKRRAGAVGSYRSSYQKQQEAGEKKQLWQWEITLEAVKSREEITVRQETVSLDGEVLYRVSGDVREQARLLKKGYSQDLRNGERWFVNAYEQKPQASVLLAAGQSFRNLPVHQLVWFLRGIPRYGAFSAAQMRVWPSGKPSGLSENDTLRADGRGLPHLLRKMIHQQGAERMYLDWLQRLLGDPERRIHEVSCQYIRKTDEGVFEIGVWGEPKYEK